MWFHVEEHLCSFGFTGLPEDLHFTFAKNSNAGLNFHITKNINDPIHPKKKPAIPILEIDGEVFSSDHLSQLLLGMFLGFLEEINIEELKKDTGLKFISFEALKNDGNYNETEKEFLERFKDLSKLTRNNTRLKITGNWPQRIVEVSESDEMLNLVYSNTTSFSNAEFGDIDGGILVDDVKNIAVIKIYGSWFKFSDDKNIADILKQIMDEKLAKYIWLRIKKSIVTLKSVTSWRQTENQYKPLKLNIIKKKGG